jgi:Na+/H+ antiporter NhaC
MKNTFVRAIVLTLTVAGLAAPSMTSAKTVAPAKTVTSSFTGYPVPLCMPSSGNVCGMQ